MKSILIKVDCCTRHNYSYLGASVQFVMDSLIQVRTLAVKDFLSKIQARIWKPSHRKFKQNMI